MIPFERTWPYETIGDDVYVNDCPFCGSSQVLLPFKKGELKEIHDGRKKLLVFPCCYNKATLVDTDRDYLLADSRLRGLPAANKYK